MTVEKLQALLDTVRPAVHVVEALVIEAGIGGHLNEEQVERATDLTLDLLKAALEGVAAVHGVEPTAEGVLALLVEDEPLEKPVVGTEAALLAGDPTIPGAPDVVLPGDPAPAEPVAAASEPAVPPAE